MGQSEIMELLEDGNEYSTKEIAVCINISHTAVWRSLRSLLKRNEVEKRTLPATKKRGRVLIWKIKKN